MSEQKVQSVPVNLSSRIESGPIEFVYKDGRPDWRGLFIRGDESFNYGLRLKTLLGFLAEKVPDELKVKEGGLDLALAFIELQDLMKTILQEVTVGGTKLDENDPALGKLMGK